MSEYKRSEFIATNKDNATVLFKFIVTLRRLELAENPSGIYHDVNHVFSVWDYAKKYGARVDDSKTKE
jgi:hypothetical protein